MVEASGRFPGRAVYQDAGVIVICGSHAANHQPSAGTASGEETFRHGVVFARP